MVITRAGTLDKQLDLDWRIDESTILDVIYDRTQVITLNSDQVAWLFGVDLTTVEAWVSAGTITPCSITPNGIKRFWREDIAGLLEAFGA